jgi:hypothetical protein
LARLCLYRHRQTLCLILCRQQHVGGVMFVNSAGISIPLHHQGDIEGVGAGFVFKLSALYRTSFDEVSEPNAFPPGGPWAACCACCACCACGALMAACQTAPLPLRTDPCGVQHLNGNPERSGSVQQSLKRVTGLLSDAPAAPHASIAQPALNDRCADPASPNPPWMCDAGLGRWP